MYQVFDNEVHLEMEPTEAAKAKDRGSCLVMMSLETLGQTGPLCVLVGLGLSESLI